MYTKSQKKWFIALTTLSLSSHGLPQSAVCYNWCQEWDSTTMETRSQKKQEEQLATLFAKLEEQAARQEQFYQQQSAKLDQQASLCREQNEKLAEQLGE